VDIGNGERAVFAHPAILWLINADFGAADGYRTKMSPRNRSVAVAESQQHVVDPTYPRSARDDGVKDWLHVRWRAADDAEHLGRCRLMLQRLAQFRIALLDFFEQPHVLDRDNGLVSECFEKSDLLVGEGSNLDSPHQNDTQRNSLTEQRSRKHRSIAESLLEIL